MQIKTTLYKQSSTGAIQQWSVFVEDDTITAEWGQVGGKIQKQMTTCYPKNVGKSNETTAEEQAISEAISKWEKQIKSGYTEDTSGEVVVKLPMKVKNYWDNKKNVVFPCDAEIKYNGVNAIYTRESGKLELKSRGGEDYPLIPHHIEEVLRLMDELNTNTLNVELFAKMYLQDIQSAVKKHNDNTHKLVAVVFDVPDKGDLEWSDRMELFKIDNTYNYLLNPFRKLNIMSHEDLESFHTEVTEEGFEGLIIRNKKGLYKYNKRSSDVFKMKLAQDSEYLIIGYSIDKKGHVVFVCKTPEKRFFKVKCKGDDKVRASIRELSDTWIGQYLKVEYEELSKDGVPLKPVGIWVREMSDDGKVLE